MQIFCWWSYAKVKNCGSGPTPKKDSARNTLSGTQQLASRLSMTLTMLWGTLSTRALRSGMFSPYQLFCKKDFTVEWVNTYSCHCDSKAEEWILRDRRRRSSGSLWPNRKTRKVRNALIKAGIAPKSLLFYNVDINIMGKKALWIWGKIYFFC